jgi:hypothetical protein
METTKTIYKIKTIEDKDERIFVSDNTEKVVKYLFENGDEKSSGSFSWQEFDGQYVFEGHDWDDKHHDFEFDMWSEVDDDKYMIINQMTDECKCISGEDFINIMIMERNGHITKAFNKTKKTEYIFINQ